MLYFHVSGHNVTIGAVKMMLFIGSPFYVTRWRNLIHFWRSWLFQYRRSCGPPTPPQPPFIKWHNLVINYRAGGMRCSAWLNFPTKDYILSVFIFVESRDSLMSFIQAASFCLGRNTQDKCVWMFQTRNVLCSSRRPYPASLWRKRGLYWLSGSEVWSGQKMVCITSNAAFLGMFHPSGVIDGDFNDFIDESIHIIFLFLNVQWYCIHWNRWSWFR